MDSLTLLSGTNYRFFNTWKNVGSSPDGTPITLASGALRARVNGGNYVNAGLTLSTDHTDGSSGVTGQHRVAVDVDNATLALASGDVLSVILSAGTVNSVSQAGTVLFRFRIFPNGLTTQEKADVQAECADALTACGITSDGIGRIAGEDIEVGGDAPASPIGVA